MEELKKRVLAEIKEKKNECWEYHQSEIKSVGERKSDIGLLDVNFEGWEDIAYFEGYIHALESIYDLINLYGTSTRNL